MRPLEQSKTQSKRFTNSFFDTFQALLCFEKSFKHGNFKNGIFETEAFNENLKKQATQNVIPWLLCFHPDRLKINFVCLL